MKAKNIVRFVGIIILILFFALYFGQFIGYYEVSKTKRNTLTNDAIERFENDVREGKEILASNYLEQEKNNIDLSLKLQQQLKSLILYYMQKLANSTDDGTSSCTDIILKH